VIVMPRGLPTSSGNLKTLISGGTKVIIPEHDIFPVSISLAGGEHKVPNWVENELTVSGRKDQIDELVKLVGSEDEEGTVCLDFEKIIPMPVELEGTGSGSDEDFAFMLVGGKKPSSIFTLQSYRSFPWVEGNIPENATDDELVNYICEHNNMSRSEMEELGNRLLNLQQKYGAYDWYDWCCNNWGTKWNAVDPALKRTRNHARFNFSTAWAPPIPVIKKLAELFPALRLRLNYWEGGMGFKGRIIYESGVEVSNTESKYSGPRGG
jgi:Ferredoxin-like domain in Api92-like protein